MRNEQVALQKLLNMKLAEIRLKNASYSLRAFGKKLGISHAALSDILRGKRIVSQKIAERVAERLHLNPQESSELIELFATRLKLRGKSRISSSETLKNAQTALQVSMDQFHLISNWYHFAILSLCETDDFKGEPQWISERLQVKVADIKVALERLERMLLIEKDKKTGRFRGTGKQFETSDNVAHLALRKSHAEALDLAKQSLERDDVNERDFTGMTMAIDPEKLPLAKKRIREFRAALCEELESGKKNEIYRLNIQLFPLTQLKPKKGLKL